MTRSPITVTAVAAAIAGTLVLAGPVAAGTPGKRVDAKRAALVAQDPAPVSGTVAKGYWGQPKSGAAGAATGAECRSFATAVNAIVDQIEQSVIEGTDVGYDANGVINGLLDAAQARGCAMGSR
ncbi:MAG TPA: hypothetical protein VIL49_03880 [Capillimicrobium sp.]